MNHNAHAGGGSPQAGPSTGEGANNWRVHPFLEGMSADHLAVLGECAMPVHFPPGQIIFREGELANRFYLLLSGRVAIQAERPGQPPVLVETVTAGDVLGWSWLFAPYTWHFTARADDPVEAVFFYGTWLRERCHADPALGYEVMRRTAAIAIRRLHATRRQLLRQPDPPESGETGLMI